MKKVFHFILLLTAVFSLSAFTASAADQTLTFMVKGSCGMCKKKIETSLRIKGVKKVNWDKESKMLTVTFNPDQISLDEIHHRVAAVGYDTEKVKASDEAYARLDDCCRYDRD